MRIYVAGVIAMLSLTLAGCPQKQEKAHDAAAPAAESAPAQAPAAEMAPAAAPATTEPAAEPAHQ